MQWWPATLARRADGVSDAEGRTAYILRYDADLALGFAEPEERTVTFMDEHELYDKAEEDFMAWRAVGDTWTPEEDPVGKWSEAAETYVYDVSKLHDYCEKMAR